MEEGLLKKKFGCYCPFAYAILLQIPNVEIIYVSWKNQGRTVIGNTWLCKKISAIHDILQHGHLDAFLMVECCCFLGILVEFFQQQYSNLSIEVLSMPRKRNKNAMSFFFREMKRVRSCWELINKETERLVINSKDFHRFHADNYWCRIIDDKAAEVILEDQAAYQYLLDHTVCFREVNGEAVEKINQYIRNDIDAYLANTDDLCPNQIYINSIVEVNDEAVSKDTRMKYDYNKR